MPRVSILAFAQSQPCCASTCTSSMLMVHGRGSRQTIDPALTTLPRTCRSVMFCNAIFQSVCVQAPPQNPKPGASLHFVVELWKSVHHSHLPYQADISRRVSAFSKVMFSNKMFFITPVVFTQALIFNGALPARVIPRKVILSLYPRKPLPSGVLPRVIP